MNWWRRLTGTKAAPEAVWRPPEPAAWVATSWQRSGEWIGELVLEQRQDPTSELAYLTVAAPRGVAWNTRGDLLAACFYQDAVRIWTVDLDGHHTTSRPLDLDHESGLAWRPGMELLAGGRKGRLTLWAADTDEYIQTDVAMYRRARLSWSPDGRFLCVSSNGEDAGIVYQVPSFEGFRQGVGPRVVTSVAGPLGSDETLAWCPTEKGVYAELGTERLQIRTVEGDTRVARSHPSLKPGSSVTSLVWSPDGRYIAIASLAAPILIYDTELDRFRAELGGTSAVLRADFSADGRFLASIGWNAIRVWTTDGWTELDAIDLTESGRATGESFIQKTNWAGLCFHPSLPIFATAASRGGLSLYRVKDTARRTVADAPLSTHYAVAKVVLVGESGVGKTHLGYRLATGAYKDHPSTHGQQFWLTEALTTTRDDGTRCEVVLWDLAGQPDYRLIHVLFLDNADAALVVFDGARRHESLDAVTFWVKALKAARPGCRTVLVSGRSDRGNTAMTAEELDEFARRNGIDGGHVETSALTGSGVDDLASLLRQSIPWDELPMIVESPALTAIKEQVLRVKERAGATVAVPADGLARLVREQDGLSGASAEEIEAALRDLEVRGYVHVLIAPSDERIVLLKPEILNNLAASLILEARRNERGLGAVDEAGVIEGAYHLREMSEVSGPLGEVLAQSVVALLLHHNVCFRERLGERSLLIFPELINEKPPRLTDGSELVDDVTYVVTGGIENVYASLVVLLGYTNVLTRIDQWQNQAQYVLDGHRLRFRQIRPRDDELEVVLSYAGVVPDGVRRVFEGLIEQFLSRRRVEVRRYPRVDCPACGFTLDRSQVIRFMDDAAEVTYCPRDGRPITLPRREGAARMSEEERHVLRQESVAARARTAFAVAMTRLRAYVTGVERRPLTLDCFVSYAWGRPAHEAWVREVLVPDLEEAGLDVVLDIAVNRAGASLTRFVERVNATAYVLVVGTPDYLVKYANADHERGTVVAAECDLINRRLVGPEERKATVVPVLREGTIEGSLPPLMGTRLPADLREDDGYFPALFDLVLDLYRVDRRLPVMRELRRTLER